MFNKYSKRKDEDISRNEKIQSINLKDNIITIHNEYENEYNNDIYFKKKYYEKWNLLNKKDLIIPKIEIEKNQFPGISLREVMIHFLNDNDYNNKYIIKRLNRRYKHRDYPTDDELKQDNEIYEGILQLRGIYHQWKSKFDDFYFILQKYKEDRNQYTCDYCKKMLFDERRHLIHCKEGKESYNKNKNKFIEKYLIKFYKYQNFSIGDSNRIIEKTKDLDYDTFINSIRGIVSKYRNYLNKIKEEYEQGYKPSEDDEYIDKYKSFIKEKNIKSKEKIHRKENFFEGKKILQEVIDEFDKEEELIKMKENINDEDNEEIEDNKEDNDDNESDNESNDDNENDNENKNKDELDENRTLVNKTDNEDNDKEDDEKEEIKNENQFNEIQRTSDLVFKSIVKNNNKSRNNIKFVNNMNTRIHTVINNNYNNKDDKNENNDKDLDIDDLYK